MRVFLDTNVLVSAFIAQGVCTQLLEECLDSHHPVISEQVLREFRAVMLEKIRSPAEKVNSEVQLLRSGCEIVEDPATFPKVCRDATDDAILAAAEAVKADCLITGDADLLVLHPYKGLPILQPSAFWRFAQSGK